MLATEKKPIRRRLDLKALRPAGGVTEFLSVTLVDDGDQDRTDANELCELPDPELELGDTGLSVEDFLAHWRSGAQGLDAAARAYGQVLYQKLLQDNPVLREAWQQALQQARDQSCGLRLEIRCPMDSAAHWRGQPLTALPFELMCDHQGYLFRRPGWSTVRRSRGLKSRALRLQLEHSARPRVQVAWANVQRQALPPMEDALFSAHDAAVAALAAVGRAEHLSALPAATRRMLADALEHGKPHVLVWIGHGLDSGSGLLLHDGEHAGYPGDHGKVVSANDFAAAVREGKVDVAMLWSCHGAGTFRSLDVGVAEALLDPDRGDVAAVLASFSALDAQAVSRLSKGLIEAWAHGDGDLESALARARAQLDELSLTWARPVLFLRTLPSDPSPRMLPLLQQPVPELLQARPDRLRWVPAVPPHTARYIDHHQRLAQLRQDLSHHSIVVLEGLAGVGKTELALALVHELRARDQDVAFVDLSSQRSLGPLRQTLGLLVSATPFEEEAPLMAALAGRRWTLVLDNAEDLLLEETLRSELLALLAALRGTGEGFRAVVTSRHALAAPGTADAAGLFRRPLARLDDTESLELFVSTAGPRLAPAQASREMLDPLLKELGGIARAIVLMAGQLGGEVDVPELCRRLQAEGAAAIVEEDLFGETLPSSPSLDRRLSKSRLASALNLSLASAAHHADAVLELFDALGTFPGGLLQELLPRDDNTDLGDALAALLDHHLVQLVGDERRIVMAAPVRGWAWRRWSEHRADTDAACLLLDAIHQRLALYVSSLRDDLGTERAQAARLRFLPEAANIVQAMATRAAAAWAPQDDVVASSLFETAALFAVHGGTAGSTLPVLGPLAAQLQARAPSTASASVAFQLGQLKMRTADLAGVRQAYEQALPIYRQIADRLGEANTLQALGDLKRRTEDLAGARQAYEQALPIYRQIADRLGEANTLQALGDLKRRTDDLDGARQDYEQALPIFRQIEDRLGEANTLKALGDLKMRTDDLPGARQAYEQALSIYRQIEVPLGEANTLRALGDLKMRTADLAGARQAYEKALPIYRQIEARLGEANTLHALGDLKMRTDDLPGARQAYEQALPIYRKIEDRLGEANTLQALGQMSFAEGQPEAAFELIVQALDIQIQVQDRLGSGGTHGYLTRIAASVGAIDLALAHGARAFRILLKADDRFGQMLVLTDLGRALLRKKDAPAGLACLLHAQSLAMAIGDPRSDSLAQYIGSFRAEGVSDADFAAFLAELRAKAPQIVDSVCDQIEQAVTAGEIDLYVLPPTSKKATDGN